MKLRTHWWDNFHFFKQKDDISFDELGDTDDKVEFSDEHSNHNKLYNQLEKIIDYDLPESLYKCFCDSNCFSCDNWNILKFFHNNPDILIDYESLIHPTRIQSVLDNWNDFISAFYIIKTILEKKNWQKEWQNDYDKENQEGLLHSLSNEKQIGELLQDAYDKLKCIRDDENPLYGIYRPDNESDLREIIEFVDSDFNLNWIDVRGFDLSCLFRNLSFFNGDISLWDVSNATNLSGMFYGCTEFNGNLSDWTINTDNTENMFRNCNINDNHKPKIQ